MAAVLRTRRGSGTVRAGRTDPGWLVGDPAVGLRPGALWAVAGAGHRPYARAAPRWTKRPAGAVLAPVGWG